MTDTEKTRASRSGDRFHYLWASWQALKLLDWTSGLEAISVEGPAAGEGVPGEEIIDVAEYFGGPDAESASLIRIHQLKHSSVRVGQPITSSELKTALGKFAAIYRDAVSKGREAQVEFNVVMNRQLDEKARRTLTELSSGQEPFHQVQGELLRGYLGFDADRAAEQAFCKRLSIEDGGHGVVHVERLLAEDLRDFLPGGGTGAEISQLMDEISSMATLEAKTNTLDRYRLLLILRATEDDLFPAKPKFEDVESVIRTADVDTVAKMLRVGDQSKVLITAFGGVGKTVFTGMLKDELAEDSLTLVFDSFAGGDYRQITSGRHEHKIALTQLANELASKGLCSALIPSQSADAAAYVRTFERKVRSACSRLANDGPKAFLTIIIDAADNAALAAEEFGTRTFVADLFEIDWPSNFRLIALCRPERRGLLRLPSGVREVQLVGFDQARTLAHLRTRFPTSSVSQGAEFHAVSSGNPRVQAMAMKGAVAADEAISALEIAASRPGEPLDALLASQVEKIGRQGHLLSDELTRLCQALAIMHPTIPLVDLAKITRVEVDAIRSFAVALGRGLYFNDDTLQFRDEPTETWFRMNHSLDAAQMRAFASEVAPYAGESPYVAAVLPQLFFEARMVDELVDLALSDGGLPAEADDLQSQEIARARARFALGAALRAGRNGDAALLAVKSGALSSGRVRRMKMFRANPDLVAKFLEQEVVDGLCSGRELTSKWPGSNLHVEALMLSSLPQRRELARARVTSSYNTVKALSGLDPDARRRLDAQIGPDEVAFLSLAAINLDGPDAGIGFLSRCRPNGFMREAARRVSSLLADAGRTEELSELICHAGSRTHIKIAIAETMFDYGIRPTDPATKLLLKMIAKREKPFDNRYTSHVHEVDPRGVTWTLLHAVRIGAVADAEAARILAFHVEPLQRYVGEMSSGMSPTGSLLAHALRARLANRDLVVEDVVEPEFYKLLSKGSDLGDRDTRSFSSNIPQLLPWATCLVNALLDGPTTSVRREAAALVAQGLSQNSGYERPFVRLNGIAELGVRILAIAPVKALVGRFASWHEASGLALSRSRLTVVRCAARNPKLAMFAIEVVNRGRRASLEDRSNADERVDELVALARAIMAVSESEARAIFSIADGEAELVGDDLHVRWYALTNTAVRLGTGSQAERAYRLLQVAETLDSDQRADVYHLAEPLYAMHPPSYYAATSRLRDRRGISFEGLLDPIMRSAAMSGGRVGALGVFAFGPRASWISVVDAIPRERAANLDSIYQQWARFERGSDGLPGGGHSRVSGAWGKATKVVKPAKVVARLDFTKAEAWGVAFQEISGYSDARRKLIRRALRKAPAKLPEVIQSLAASSSAREDDFVVAATFASKQGETAGLNAAIACLSEAFGARFAADIATKSYDRQELRVFAQAAGICEEDLLAAGFLKLGENAHNLSHEQYFSLASHIARTLDVAEAARVFDALAKLFDDMAPPDTAADGPYVRLPSVPLDLAACLAGLIWAGLGDMAASRRWEAAHAVVLLVQIGDLEALAALASFANGSADPAPFHDARFPRYELHSRLWLLFALERAASELNATLLEPFVPWLLQIVDGPPHAANQVAAQRVLQALADRGFAVPNAAWGDTLARRLHAEWEELDWQGQRSRADPFAPISERDSTEHGYPFFFDFQQYWSAPLARVFGTTEQALAQRALAVAQETTGYESDSIDPRHAAGVFNQNGAYSSHGSWPHEEDFEFYSAVHALLNVAGALAQTAKAFKEPEDSLDAYTAWLNEFMPRRRDGRWLSDRRDPPPTPAPEQRIAGESKEGWRWSLSPQAFESIVGHGTDEIVVDAYYESTLGELSEEVSISSALIANTTARAFLVALQTNSLGGRAFCFPTSDHDEWDESPVDSSFRLAPWIDRTSHPEAIDRTDDRGKNVVYPPPRPERGVVDRFGLASDEDLRECGICQGE